MKKIATLVLAAAAVSFVAAPMVASAHNAKVKCYGVDTCKGKKNCKEKAFVMTTAKKCAKMNGSTTEPTTSSTDTNNTGTTTTTTNTENTGNTGTTTGTGG
jgi:hypothetical protein